MKSNKSMRWPYSCPFTPSEWTFLQKKYHLSPRELQVVICICHGCDNKQIGESLNIKINTAKSFLGKAYLKTGVNNKVHLLLKFINDISVLVSDS